MGEEKAPQVTIAKSSSKSVRDRTHRETFTQAWPQQAKLWANSTAHHINLFNRMGAAETRLPDQEFQSMQWVVSQILAALYSPQTTI